MIVTTAPVVEHLRHLVSTGLFGRTVEEAAERLLCERLVAMLPPPQLPPARSPK